MNEALGAVPPPGQRRAALALHALSAQDRAWVLRQLSPAQRSRLEELLHELQQLGIPADQRLIDDALASASTPPGAGAAPLSGASPAALWAAIARETRAAQLVFLSALDDIQRVAVLQCAALQSAVHFDSDTGSVQRAPASHLRAALEAEWLASVAKAPEPLHLKATDD